MYKRCPSFLELADIHFSYGEKQILCGVELGVAQGDIVSLIGISGSGKTTLFRVIAGLACPERGNITQQEPGVTYMRQDDLLLPWRTVMKNLLLLSELGKEGGSATREEALEMLAEVGLVGCEEAYPDELSGGMRQRVALARALLQKKPLLLLDEPFGSLDVPMREELYHLLRQIRTRYGMTILLVTHDFRDALSLSDRICVLMGGRIGATFDLSDDQRSDPYFIEQLSGQIRKALFNERHHTRLCVEA